MAGGGAREEGRQTPVCPRRGGSFGTGGKWTRVHVERACRARLGTGAGGAADNRAGMQQRGSGCGVEKHPFLAQLIVRAQCVFRSVGP